jgi:hypothetical protein
MLQELHISVSSMTIMYCDNVSVVYMMVNQMRHLRTKDIEINIFVCEKVALGQVWVLHELSSH